MAVYSLLHIQSLLDSLCTRYHAEPDIVREYSQKLDKNQIRLPGTRIPISIRSGFIHQRPYAFPTSGNLCGKQKVELGDILWVVKRVTPKGAKEYRISLSQAKRPAANRWDISSHQFEFLTNMRAYPFQFGKTVHRKANIPYPIVWTIRRTNPWFANYLFLDDKGSLTVEAASMTQHYSRHCIDFAVPNSGRSFSSYINKRVNTCPFHAHFLYHLLAKNPIGQPAVGKMRTFLELVYKRINWTLAPPEEIEDYFIEDGGNFAVVEFTIAQTEEAPAPR